MSVSDEELIDLTSEPPSVDDCLKVRKWWCFVLSSIFTFLSGLFLVLFFRLCSFICCRKEPELAPNDPKLKEQKGARGKAEFEGTFMTEAKDWAGELISGQTTTGRILVSLRLYLTHATLTDAATATAAGLVPPSVNKWVIAINRRHCFIMIGIGCR